MSATEIQTRIPHVLEDPSMKAVARVYALAYLDAAASAGQQNPLEDLTSFYDDVLKRNPDFTSMLASPAISLDHKLGVIERAVVPQSSPFFANFLRVLARHGRLDLIPAILDQAWLENERRNNQKRVQVRSATPLTDSQVSEIRDRLRSQLQFEPIVQSSVDSSLLGGIVIQVGDTVYDSSLRTRIRALRDRLRERYLNEIQSGRNRFSYSEGN
jgi:F-type H+-transporting ATPase subunit delta